MNGKTLIDWVDRHLVRQDFNRNLALDCLNQAQRDIFKNKSIHKLFTQAEEVYPVDGFVYLPLLKNPEIVEFHLNGESKKLEKIVSYTQAESQYGSASLKDPYILGIPEHYMVGTDGIRLFPIPTEGYVNVAGEFFPEDLEDSVTSENILTREIHEALILKASARYFEILTEYDKMENYETRATVDIESYIRSVTAQRSSFVKLMERDPWRGRITKGLPTRKPMSGITRIDGGDWDIVIPQNAVW